MCSRAWWQKIFSESVCGAVQWEQPPITPHWEMLHIHQRAANWSERHTKTQINSQEVFNVRKQREALHQKALFQVWFRISCFWPEPLLNWLDSQLACACREVFVCLILVQTKLTRSKTHARARTHSHRYTYSCAHKIQFNHLKHSQTLRQAEWALKGTLVNLHLCLWCGKSR